MHICLPLVLIIFNHILTSGMHYGQLIYYFTTLIYQFLHAYHLVFVKALYILTFADKNLSPLFVTSLNILILCILNTLEKA